MMRTEKLFSWDLITCEARMGSIIELDIGDSHVRFSGQFGVHITRRWGPFKNSPLNQASENLRASVS